MNVTKRNTRVRNAEAQSLGEVLKQLISRMGIGRKLDEARMVDAWGIVAGPQVIAVTDSVWVKGNKLFVRITSSTWRHELHLQRQQWKSKLNEYLEGDFVDEVIFR
jgi:predicted nucleic acid-binding Zn ribbon protein